MQIDLFTLTDIVKILKINRSSLLKIIELIDLKFVLKNNNREYYNSDQLKKINAYIALQKNDYKLLKIVETTYYIYESKMNYEEDI